MKVCNEEAGAKALKGDERRKFMSECLSSAAWRSVWGDC